MTRYLIIEKISDPSKLIFEITKQLFVIYDTFNSVHFADGFDIKFWIIYQYYITDYQWIYMDIFFKSNKFKQICK